MVASAYYSHLSKHGTAPKSVIETSFSSHIIHKHVRCFNTLRFFPTLLKKYIYFIFEKKSSCSGNKRLVTATSDELHSHSQSENFFSSVTFPRSLRYFLSYIYFMSTSCVCSICLTMNAIKIKNGGDKCSTSASKSTNNPTKNREKQLIFNIDSFRGVRELRCVAG